MNKRMHLWLFMLIGLAAFSGCQKSPEKEIVGIWEVYECDNPQIVGSKFYFQEDGKVIIRDVTGFSGKIMLYKLDNNKVYFYSKNDVSRENPKEISDIKIKNNRFILKSIKDGYLVGSHELKFQKVGDL